MIKGRGGEFERKLHLSGDGSHTLYVPPLDEHYHSVYGAMGESRHIFVQAGYKHVARQIQKINILEIGFGTGLNALLTALEAQADLCRVDYESLEAYPLEEEIIRSLNYPDLIDCGDLFIRMHEAEWDRLVDLTEYFRLAKLRVSLHDYQPAPGRFDLVYFDAFGPDVQPEMWSTQVFVKLASGMRKGGFLVTYSTKGDVKRSLKAAGFSLEKLPGPKGKREILRATLL